MELTSIQKRIIEEIKQWDKPRLIIEMEAVVKTKTDDEIEELFFDDIATEEEHLADRLKR